MRLIPALDIIKGSCVRLTQGDYARQKTYSLSPLDQALYYADLGFRYLHFVDLDGARMKRPVNLNILECLAAKTDLYIDAGGGINSLADARSFFDAGATQINIGSLAIRKPESFISILETFGADKIILSADTRFSKIAVNAWQDISEITLTDFIQNYRDKSISYFTITDIQRDGMMAGPNIELYRSINAQFNIKLLASGGIRSMQDICDCEDAGCEAVIIGKALLESRIPEDKLTDYVEKENNTLS